MEAQTCPCGTPLDALHMTTGKLAKLCPGKCRGCAEQLVENFDTSEDPEVQNLSDERMDYIIKNLGKKKGFHYYRGMK